MTNKINIKGRNILLGSVSIITSVAIIGLALYIQIIYTSSRYLLVVLILALGLYLLFDGCFKLSTKHLEANENKFTISAPFRQKTIDCRDIDSIATYLEYFGGEGVIITIKDKNNRKIRIAQSDFKIAGLFEVIKLLREIIAHNPAIEVKDKENIIARFEDIIKASKKAKLKK